MRVCMNVCEDGWIQACMCVFVCTVSLYAYKAFYKISSKLIASLFSEYSEQPKQQCKTLLRCKITWTVFETHITTPRAIFERLAHSSLI